ncbi:hypothetical protein DL95DRAFT_409935 [Leptodontidium sp. 2 PMI_412]|nr:hypothetical protein BKA61DRAFT_679892 [Leptodontidium sp. MPI-SDFR-AT-0119]KAH9213766.1 hypothetical protein DL95DRAFT_409935 [Leptodontidium sp. 2 PMI_412]
MFSVNTANRATSTTGRDTHSATNRRVMYDTYSPVYEPYLPTEERGPFIYGMPTAPPSSKPNPTYPNTPPELPTYEPYSISQDWVFPGIGLPTLTTIISLLTLSFRIPIYIFYLADAVLAYLLYPLLGLVMLAFMFSHFSDAHAHPHLQGYEEGGVARIVSTKIITATTTRTLFSTSCSTIEEPEPSIESSELPAVENENTVELPTCSVSEILSVVSTEFGEDVLTTSSSEETSQATGELVVEMASISSVASSSESVLAGSETSTASPQISQRAATLSPISGPVRSSTPKKRMYE